MADDIASLGIRIETNAAEAERQLQQIVATADRAAASGERLGKAFGSLKGTMTAGLGSQIAAEFQTAERALGSFSQRVSASFGQSLTAGVRGVGGDLASEFNSKVQPEFMRVAGLVGDGFVREFNRKLERLGGTAGIRALDRNLDRAQRQAAQERFNEFMGVRPRRETRGSAAASAGVFRDAIRESEALEKQSRALGAEMAVLGGRFDGPTRGSERFGSSIRGVTSAVNLFRAGIIGLAARELFQGAAGMARLADEAANAQKRIEALTGSATRARALVGAAQGAARNVDAPAGPALPLAEMARDPLARTRLAGMGTDQTIRMQALFEQSMKAARVGGSDTRGAEEASRVFIEALTRGLLDAESFAKIKQASAGLAQAIAEQYGRTADDFERELERSPRSSFDVRSRFERGRDVVEDRFARSEAAPNTDRVFERLSASGERLVTALDEATGVSGRFKAGLLNLADFMDRYAKGIEKWEEEVKKATPLRPEGSQANNALEYLGELIGRLKPPAPSASPTANLASPDLAAFEKNVEEATAASGRLDEGLTGTAGAAQDAKGGLVIVASEAAGTGSALDRLTNDAILPAITRIQNQLARAASPSPSSAPGGYPSTMAGFEPPAAAPTPAAPRAPLNLPPIGGPRPPAFTNPDFTQLLPPLERIAENTATTAQTTGSLPQMIAGELPRVIDASRITPNTQQFERAADISHGAAVAWANGVTRDIADRAISAARWGGMVDRFGNVVEQMGNHVDELGRSASEVARNAQMGPATTSTFNTGIPWILRGLPVGQFFVDPEGRVRSVAKQRSRERAAEAEQAREVESDGRQNVLSIVGSSISQQISALSRQRSELDEKIGKMEQGSRPDRPDPYLDKNPDYFYRNGTSAFKENDPMSRLLTEAEAQRAGIEQQIQQLENQAEQAERLSELMSAGVRLTQDEIAAIERLTGEVAHLGSSQQQSDFARMIAAAIQQTQAATTNTLGGGGSSGLGGRMGLSGGSTATRTARNGFGGTFTGGLAKGGIVIDGDAVEHFATGGHVTDTTERFAFTNTKVERFAEGGPIRGPGTGTSDSIPAVGPGGRPLAVSNGEFIVNAKSTEKHRTLIEAINSDKVERITANLVERVKSNSSRKVEKFATGGFIGTAPAAPMPRFAEGGLIRIPAIASIGLTQPVTVNVEPPRRERSEPAPQNPTLIQNFYGDPSTTRAQRRSRGELGQGMGASLALATRKA